MEPTRRWDETPRGSFTNVRRLNARDGRVHDNAWRTTSGHGETDTHSMRLVRSTSNFDEALKGSREILIAPTEPSVGVRVAFILDDGAPVELLQFYTAKAVRPKTRRAAEQRAAPDDGAPAKEMRRRR